MNQLRNEARINVLISQLGLLQRYLWGELDSLRHALCAGARLVRGISKCDHALHYMRDVIHWLPVSQCMQFTISASVMEIFILHLGVGNLLFSMCALHRIYI